jgi:hypothetical protein
LASHKLCQERQSNTVVFERKQDEIKYEDEPCWIFIMWSSFVYELRFARDGCWLSGCNPVGQ